jgi:hypothetical protein
MNPSTRRDQMAFARHVLHDDENEPQVPLSVIRDFLGIVKQSMEWQISRSRTTPKHNRCPRIPWHEAYLCILNIAQAQFAEQMPLTCR